MNPAPDGMRIRSDSIYDRMTHDGTSTGTTVFRRKDFGDLFHPYEPFEDPL